MLMRTLGRSSIQVSAMGLGCWAIGGPFWHDGWVGYGNVDDAESIRAEQMEQIDVFLERTPARREREG